MKKIKAFTLLELSIVFFVISIIIGLTIATQRPYDKSIKLLYQRAYLTLKDASYNVLIEEAADDNPFPTDPVALCQKLADKNTGFINTVETSCNSNLVPTSGSSIPSNALQFVAVNGMKFYFTDRMTKTITQDTITYNIGFRLVIVDLNGDSGPNKFQESASDSITDTVPFVLTDEGEVYPIGLPVVDTGYLTAKVHYPDGPGADDFDQYSGSMSYYDAKTSAWGQTQTIYVGESIDFNDTLPGGSLFKTTHAVIPDPSAVVDSANGCTINNDSDISPCEVEINRYLSN